MSDADILAKLARWAKQNPEANAGDHAGEELLELVRSISASPAPAATGVRCYTCHRIIPKDVSLQPIGHGDAHLPAEPQTSPTRDAIVATIQRAARVVEQWEGAYLANPGEIADAILALPRPVLGGDE